MQSETSTVTNADIKKRPLGFTITPLAKPNFARDPLASLAIPNPSRHQLQSIKTPLTSGPIQLAAMLIPLITQLEVYLDPHTALVTT